MSSLLTIGTMAFDTIETPFSKVDRIIGGSANYIAWSASHLCENVQLCAIVGDDYPLEEIDLLMQRGVSFDGVERVENAKTFYWEGKYDLNMNDRTTLCTDLNVLRDFNPTLPESYNHAEYVMLGNLTPKIQLQVLDQLKSSPQLIAMDTMNYWIENDAYRPDLMKVLKRVDLLIVNEEEARLLGNDYSLVRSAKKIMNEMGPKFLIIKKGENGALLFHEQNVYFAPALPLEETFDPTGAGDAFAGGFMGFVCHTKDQSFENLKRAVIYGSAMASFCVEKFGPNRLKEITPFEIENRIEDFINLTQVDIELQEES